MNSDLLHLDPPDHTRLRRLVAAAFSRRRVDDLVPRMVQIADALLDAMARSPEPVDLIDAYAFPLPMTVICELLGVPAADAATFRRWSTTIVSGALSDPAEWVASATSLVEYTRALVEIKRATPTDDLLSALIASRDGADRLSEDELTSMVVLLLLAGHETTVNLIGNAANLLFEHPAQLAALRADPGLIPGVVEEVLRFESPVQVATPRFAAEQLRISDRLIEKGDMVFASVLTAGRFDDRLDHPAEFDPRRADQHHVSFGHGIHHCIGAPLARAEGAVALSRLLFRFPEIRPAVPPDSLNWRPSVLMHGLLGLPVALS
jgi:cytochrome P450